MTKRLPSRKPSKKPSTKPDGGDVWRWWLEANESAGRTRPTRHSSNTSAGKSLSALVRAGDLTEDELKACMAAFLEDTDKFLISNGHALRFLPGRLDAYRNKPPSPIDQKAERIERERDESCRAYADSGIEERIAREAAQKAAGGAR